MAPASSPRSAMRRAGRALLIAAVLVIGGGSACAAPPAPTAAPVQTIRPPIVATEDSTPPTPVIGTIAPRSIPTATLPLPPTPDAPDPVVIAIRTLAASLNIPEERITLLETTPVQWNDSSLGCPREGQAYLPVITPGYLMTLAVDETVYQVHTDLAGTAIVCSSTSDPIGPGTVPDPIVAEFIMQGRARLAAERGIAPEEVALVRSEAVEWSDSGLGCRVDEDTAVLPVITPGYRIVFAIDEERFEFHTDSQRMILCLEPTE